MEPHYPHSSAPFRPKFAWPDGNHVAVVITINTESWDLTRPTKEKIYAGGPGILPEPLPGDVPDWPNYTWREYGHRVGYWRIMEILDQHRVRASNTLNAQIGEKYPEMIREGLKRGWEFNGHGYEQGTLLTDFAYDIEAERAYIRTSTDLFTKYVGERPLGWLSSSLRSTGNTVKILAEQGYLWHCDYLNDDQPYPFTIDGKRMVAMPYSFEVNDYMAFYRRNFTTNQWVEMLIEQLDVLYTEAVKTGSGRLMNIGLHPHVIGVPFRARSIDAFLSHARSRAGVFFPSRGEIARHTLAQG